MGKRFTDTDKWKKQWFGDLTPKNKLLWIYLCDTCNAAGIADFSERIYSFLLGFKVTKEMINDAFGEKVMWLEDNKLFIVPFIEFQYEKLSRECRPHLPIIKMLERYGIDFETLDPDNLTTRQMRRRIGKNIRQAIFARDKFECQYCGAHENLEIDHIVPLSKGGTNEDDNLITACHACNTLKGDKDLEEIAETLNLGEFGNFSLNRVSNILNRVFKKLNRVSNKLNRVFNFSNTLEEKEKEKEKEQEITKGGMGERELFDTPSAFDLFWAAYPKYRIGNKDKARRAFEAAIKRAGVTAEQLVAKAKEYANSEEATKDGGMFAKGAAPWLNDDRFLQAYKPAKSSERNIEQERAEGEEEIRRIFGD